MTLFQLLKTLQKLVEKIRAFLFKSLSKLRQDRNSKNEQLRKPDGIRLSNNDETQKVTKKDNSLNSINLPELLQSSLESTDLEKQNQFSIFHEYPFDLHMKNNESIASTTNKNNRENELETRSSLFPEIDYSQFDSSNPKFVSLLPCSTVP